MNLFKLFSIRFAPRPARAALALVIAAAAAPAHARGDNLDAALREHAPEVMRYLRDHHAHNVGILQFRVQRAGHPASFKTGPINDNLPERLEYALIAANPTAAPIGIIHDASHVAALKKLPRYDNPTGQRTLFGQTYPLAWGHSRVTPDLLLTGVVNVRPDLKSVTVHVEAFAAGSDKQAKVASFPVATDRSLLADLNESFRIKSRDLKKRKTRAINLDEEAVEDVVQQQATPKVLSTDENLVSYEIRYDNQPQQVTTDPASPGEFHVAEPRANQVVTFLVRSLASERIGLVLMVNGKSTLYEEDGDPAHCKAWVLEPGREYGITGFQVDNNTRKPFRVLSDEESAAAVYSANTGLIQFHIVREGPTNGGNEFVDNGNDTGGGNAITNDNPPPLGDPAPPMNIGPTIRGLNHAALVKAGKTRSLAELKKTIEAHSRTRVRKNRGLIVGESGAVEGGIQNDEIRNPVFVQSIAVRYYRPKG